MCLETLEKSINIYFSDKALLLTAFTHKSYAREHKVASYERLEFLGDSLLNMIVSDYLFHYCDEDEGILTKQRAAYVCEKSLRQAAGALKLEDYIRVGREVAIDYKFKVPTDDLYEALVAVIYLDKGYDVAREFVASTLITLDISPDMDYKSMLQEIMQKEYRDNVVVYQTYEINPSAIKDEIRFESAVYVHGELRAYGRGRNKKSAENQGAKNLYMELTHGE